MRVAVVSGDDEQVGALAALDRAELLVPAQDLRRVARRRARSASKSDRPSLLRLLTSRASFSSPSRFLLPLGDQSGPSAISTPASLRLAHVGRLPVEEQVAERRPDHRRRRRSASTSKSCFWSATQWIPASELVTAQSPFGSCSARKCSRADSSVPSLRCRSRQSKLSRRFRNFVRSFASTSAMCVPASGSSGLVGLLDVPDDALVEALDARRSWRARCPARSSSRATRHLALDVADDRRHVLRRVREHLHRPGDQLAVRVALGPLVAVRVAASARPRAGARCSSGGRGGRSGPGRSCPCVSRTLTPSKPSGGGASAFCTAAIEPSRRRRRRRRGPVLGRPWSRRGRRARTRGRRAGRPGCRGTRSISPARSRSACGRRRGSDATPSCCAADGPACRLRRRRGSRARRTAGRASGSPRSRPP